MLFLRFRIVDGTPKTLEDISKSMGITRERVRQIEYWALVKLRRSPYIKEFKGYFDGENHLVKRI